MSTFSWRCAELLSEGSFLNSSRKLRESNIQNIKDNPDFFEEMHSLSVPHPSQSFWDSQAPGLVDPNTSHKQNKKDIASVYGFYKYVFETIHKSRIYIFSQILV